MHAQPFKSEPFFALTGFFSAKAQGIKVKKGLFSWTASGRAIANGRGEAVTKLLFDDSPAPDAGESIGMAEEIAHGSCTDVPPARK